MTTILSIIAISCVLYAIIWIVKEILDLEFDDTYRDDDWYR